MSQTTSDRVRWTTADLELFPDNGNRYEIIVLSPGNDHEKRDRELKLKLYFTPGV